jgi:hypothetical protein
VLIGSTIQRVSPPGPHYLGVQPDFRDGPSSAARFRGPVDHDAQLLCELTDQRFRRLLARQNVAAGQVPHIRIRKSGGIALDEKDLRRGDEEARGAEFEERRRTSRTNLRPASLSCALSFRALCGEVATPPSPSTGPDQSLNRITRRGRNACREVLFHD